MDEKEKTLQDYIAIISRRKIPMLIIMLVVFVIGALIALIWPPTYNSSATILIKEQEIPMELVRSTVTSYAAQRIQTITQRVMTRSNLMEIIEKYGLYKKERKRKTIGEVIDAMRDDIGIDMISADVVDPRSGRPTTATIAFKLSFTGNNPASTQKVAGELTSLFLAENLKTRKEKASQTYIFLTEEADRLTGIIADQEKKLAEFKQRHVDSLPGMMTINISALDRAERELVLLDSDLSSNEERIIYLSSQLAQTNPLTNMRSATGQSILDPVSRLKSLEAEYASISVRYSSQHPDVVKIKREIEGLKVLTGAQPASDELAKTLTSLRSEYGVVLEKYQADHPDVIRLAKSIKALESKLQQSIKSPEQQVMELQPDNPTYISILNQIKSVKANIKATQQRKAKLRVKIDEYEQRIAISPQVERDHLALTREHTNAVARFRDIRAKQMQAEIGQELERESKGESFVLIDPAQYPEQPVKPNRLAIIFIGLVLAIGVSFGYAAVAEGLDSSVRGINSITQMLTAAPLAVIPVIYNSQDYIRKKRTLQLVVGSSLGSFILLVLFVHFFWIPLDVLWFRGIRKAENVIGI